jgi:hypothetical protein
MPLLVACRWEKAVARAKSPSPQNPVGSESSDETWHPSQAPSRESALNREVLKVPCSCILTEL